jgi:tetrapyrrole methylase family protein/MazG family protein
MSKYTMSDLLNIMAKLRSENGCPWDKAQTRQSLKPYVLEEAYEVVDAIDSDDKDELIEELGDLLLQIVFHCQLGKECGEFDMDDVIDGICEKMIYRHPHIFGNVHVENTEEVLKNWEELKQDEKNIKSQTESMNNIPKALPALMLAHKVQEKARRVGFDWDDIEGPLNKVQEELDELKEVYKGADRDKIREELGDLFFAVVNVARFLKVNPEIALRDAVYKFIRRFNYVEEAAKKLDKSLKDMTLNEMDDLWEEGKVKEKKL